MPPALLAAPARLNVVVPREVTERASTSVSAAGKDRIVPSAANDAKGLSCRTNNAIGFDRAKDVDLVAAKGP